MRIFVENFYIKIISFFTPFDLIYPKVLIQNSNINSKSIRNYRFRLNFFSCSYVSWSHQFSSQIGKVFERFKKTSGEKFNALCRRCFVCLKPIFFLPILRFICFCNFYRQTPINWNRSTIPLNFALIVSKIAIKSVSPRTRKMILILPTHFEAHICRTAFCQNRRVNFTNDNCIWKFAEQVGDLNSNVKSINVFWIMLTESQIQISVGFSLNFILTLIGHRIFFSFALDPSYFLDVHVVN